MKKTDVHIHAALQRQMYTPSPRNPEDCYLAQADEVLEHLEKQGIDRAILMSAGMDPLHPFDGNAACRQMSQQHPGKLFWMANVDVAAPSVILPYLKEQKRLGAVGVGELVVNQWIDSSFLTAVFEAAEQLELPVTFHMSPEPGYSYGICDRPGLELLEQALQRFPKLKFVGHSQMFWLEISADCPRSGNEARCAMGRNAVIPGGRVIELLEKYPNLYADLSAYSGSCAILRDADFGCAFLERWQDRLLFGTDTLNKHQTFPLGKHIDSLLEDGKLSQTAYEKICWRNAENIYRLSSSL